MSTLFKNNSVRLGLLGPTLGLSPTGGHLNNDTVEYDDDDADEYAFDEESEYFINEPLTALTDPFTETQQVVLVSQLNIFKRYFLQCCCFPVGEECPDPFGSNSDLISLGVLNSSSAPSQSHHDLDPQDGLIFRFAPIELVSATDCPESQRSCCYDLDIDLQSLAVSCLSPDQAEVAQISQTAEIFKFKKIFVERNFACRM